MESFGKVEEFADTLVGFLIIYILQFLEMETQFSFYMLHSAWQIVSRLVDWTEAGKGLRVWKQNS